MTLALRYLILLACAALVSCAHLTSPLEWGKTLGLIYVDRPEVVSRERLIKDRRIEEEWLQAQLGRAGEAAMVVQGSRRSESFASVGFAAEIQAQNPLVQLGRAKANTAIQTELYQQDLQRLYYEQEKLRAQACIDKLKAATPAGQTGSTPAAPAVDDPCKPAQFGAATPGSFGSVAFPQGLVDPYAAGAPSALASLKTELDAMSDAQFSFAEDFRERLEFRELVRNELLETRLDDAHDIAGNTLYRLKFDTTVLPDNDTSAWAVVEVTISNASEDPCTENKDWMLGLYAKWADSADAKIKDSVKARQDEPARPLSASINTDLTKLGVSTAQERQRVGAALAEYDRLIKTTPLESVVDRLAFAETYHLSATGETRVVNPDDEDQFKKFCKQLSATKSIRLYSYAVTPKDSAQRLAEDGGERRLRQLSLAAAMLSGGTAANVGFKSAREELALANAVRRQPLVVGFGRPDEATDLRPAIPQPVPCKTNDDNDCSIIGWVIGPRVQLNRKGTTWEARQRASQYALAALVSIPGWWNRIHVSVQTFWRREDGKTITPKDRRTNGNPRIASFTVDLPGDATSIGAALAPQLSREPTGVVLEPRQVKAGRPARLLVEGENLWRDPVVYLGSQPASSVEVLPGMRGLAVHFDDVVRPPNCSNDSPCEVPLYVWTSDSRKSAKLQKVVVYPDETVQSQIEVSGPTRLIENEPFELRLKSGVVPSGFSKLSAVVRVAGAPSDFTELGHDTLSNDRAIVKVTMKKGTMAPPPVDGTPIQLGLRFKSTPGSNDELFIANPATAIYYATADGAKARLSAAGNSFPLKIDIKLPEEVDRAYPGFRRDAARLKGQVKFDGATSPFDVVSTPRADGTIEFNLMLDTATQAKWAALAAGKTADITCGVDGGVPLPLTASTLKITKP